MGFKYSVVEKFWTKLQLGGGGEVPDSFGPGSGCGVNEMTVWQIPSEAIITLLEPFLYLMARAKVLMRCSHRT